MKITPDLHIHDTEFSALSRALFASAQDFRGEKLFRTEGLGLFEVYLASLPSDERQHHNCNCCKAFLRKYGGLVAIDEFGNAHSVFWNPGYSVSEVYDNAICNLASFVESAKIKGTLVSPDEVWGTPVTGPWTHFHYSNPATYLGRGKSASEVQALDKENFRTLNMALASYRPDDLKQAVHLLSNDALGRSEKAVSHAKWLLDLKEALIPTRNQTTRRNLLWRAVASAPAGWCTPRSSMIGTLLDDLQEGKSFDEVSRAWTSKMHPLRYQRPTSTPSLGNIEAAEKLIDKLGIAKALERRFARLEEVPLIWIPVSSTSPGKSPQGVFNHLRELDRPSGHAMLNLPVKPITWTQFQANVLPLALKIEVLINSGPNNFTGLLTAVHSDAPDIFQWDGPLSWYVYHNGGSPQRWGINSGWQEIAGISLRNAHQNHVGSAIFHIPAMKDTDMLASGLFPEILKASLHEVRKTIEAHSNRIPAQDPDLGTANGLSCGREGMKNTIRVTTSTGPVNYAIDRWI